MIMIYFYKVPPTGARDAETGTARWWDIDILAAWVAAGRAGRWAGGVCKTEVLDCRAALHIQGVSRGVPTLPVRNRGILARRRGVYSVRVVVLPCKGQFSWAGGYRSLDLSR